MLKERQIDRMNNTTENRTDIDSLGSFHPLLNSVCIKLHVEHFTISMIFVKNTKNTMILKNACRSYSTLAHPVTLISICLKI